MAEAKAAGIEAKAKYEEEKAYKESIKVLYSKDRKDFKEKIEAEKEFEAGFQAAEKKNP